MRWLSIVGTWLFSRQIDRDLARGWRLVRAHPEFVVVAFGVLLRCTIYYQNRAFWLDEGSLWGNIVGQQIFDFSHPLTNSQLAPVGFLIAQRALVRALGPSRYVARLIPLASGIAALGLFARLARRIMPRRPALVALVLFAFSDDLVYYASEMKPYSLDVAVGLAIILAAAGALNQAGQLRPIKRHDEPHLDPARTAPRLPGPTEEHSGNPIPGRRVLVLAILAIVAPWCSFPSAFVVAGGGLTLIVSCLHARRYRDAAVWGAVGAIWLASSVVAYKASLALLSSYSMMQRFWWFSFLPVWPLSCDNLSRALGILLEIFVNPLNLVGPFWPWVGVMIPLSLLMAGGVSLARRSPRVCALLVLPIALAMGASAMSRYPFHGRMILGLVPAFFLLIAEGSEWLRERVAGRAKLAYKAVMFLLLAYPCLATLSQVDTHERRDFNPHGDLHNNLFMHYGLSVNNPSGMAPRRR